MNEAPARSLNPALAFFANIVGIALGYVYIGRMRLALLIIAAAMVVISLASWSRFIFTQTGFYVTAALLVSIAIIPLIHCPIIGEAIHEPYVAIVEGAFGMGKEFGPMTLGDSEYFLLGDNRTRSKDSRYLGSVPADRLHGLVRLRWFSYDGGIRWDRFPFVFQ